MTAKNPHKWWSTLKSTVFSTSSSRPHLTGVSGELICESADNTDLLLDHFYIK